MRLTTEFFVSALMRRVFAAGGFAAVERHGAGEAGALFIRQRFRDGLETLYGPAPQSVFDASDDGRRFEIRAERCEAAECEAILDRERRFDPDLWLLELEVDAVAGLIELAGAERPDKGW
ncbi:MAG: DUF1491 family protein [Rhizobium sp.]|nr:DUF1491 family protein [Rhizobium sp.]MBX9459214.1 DUF1491 family protein [Rhizobium sp.]